MTTNFKFVQSQDFALAGAGAVAGATSIILKSFKAIDGVTNLTMTDFGVIGFGTIEPGNGTQEEQISFTGVTHNANGTATLTGVESVLFVNPYTGSSGLSKTHPGSATFIITNTAGYYNEFLVKSNDETITGIYSFTQVPNTLQDPVSGDDLTRRSWVLAQINGGPVSTDKVVVAGTAGETIAAGNLVYLKFSDNRWWLADADTASTVENVILGIAQGAGTAGNSISSGVLLSGTDTNQSGLTASNIYYASNTLGGISNSPGTKEVTVGISLSTTSILFYPRYNQQLTEDQQDALAGTVGTPSASNKYVTELTLASAIVAGLVEEATQTEVNDGTSTGGTGARLFENPGIPSYFEMGVGRTNIAKGYFNMQLPFLLWTGATDGAADTQFDNWIRSDATDVAISPNGLFTDFVSTGAATIYTSCFDSGSNDLIQFAGTNILIVQFFAQLPATATGNIQLGIVSSTAALTSLYNANTDDKVTFAMDTNGDLYATISKVGVGVSTTQITGVTNTLWNDYRIVYDISSDAKFYVNGVLKATLSGANLPAATEPPWIGFGRSNTALFKVLAPTLSLELNP